MSNLVNNRMAAKQSINRLIEKSRNARRGFTVLELLVASMLLGMLMTILTMIFSQSSIAWRTGLAGEKNRRGERQGVSDFRYESDNAYPDMQGNLLCVQSVFKADGSLRQKGLLDEFYNNGSPKQIRKTVPLAAKASESFESDRRCSGSDDSGSDYPDANYVVNVKSAGPDRTMDTYDDIWSFPDDPDEW